MQLASYIPLSRHKEEERRSKFESPVVIMIHNEHLKMSGDSGPCSPADIDECESMVSGCQHSCTNTAGSYECMCDRGYSLSTDGHSCEGVL